MEIAVSVSRSRSIPLLQGEGCHRLAIRGQWNAHDTAGFRHKAHPSDAVLLSQESGRAALGAGERASNTMLWFLSVRNTGSFFMKILRSQ